MTLPVCYAVEYADARRASRVAVAPREIRYMERLVPADRHPLPAAPQSVVIGPLPHCWGLTVPGRVLVVDAAGTKALARDPGRWLLELNEVGLRHGNRSYTAGTSAFVERRPFGVFDQTCIEVASRWHDPVWTTIVQNVEPFSMPQLRVAMRGSDAPRWSFAVDGHGTGAITDDGIVVTAMIDRVVHVLRASDDLAAREPIVLARVELPHEPFAVTATSGGVVVLSAIEAESAGAAARSGRLHGRGERAFDATWRTEVRKLGLDGVTQWTAELPFAGVQPAIELAEDRVAIAGRGLACVEAGRVCWTKAGTVDVYATAYVDGTLAVSAGSRLLVVDRDGRDMKVLDVPERARIVTPPAIGPDGALAIGTTTYTFVVP